MQLAGASNRTRMDLGLYKERGVAAGEQREASGGCGNATERVEVAARPMSAVEHHERQPVGDQGDEQFTQKGRCGQASGANGDGEVMQISRCESNERRRVLESSRRRIGVHPQEDGEVPPSGRFDRPISAPRVVGMSTTRAGRHLFLPQVHSIPSSIVAKETGR